MVADLLEECLVEAGFEVCGIARTVSHAIVVARRHEPTVAIVDVTLADDECGTSIVRRLNALWPFGVLFASGGSQLNLLANSGGTAVIVKPYQITDLLSAIHVVVDLVESGETTRPMPRCVRLLAGAAVPGLIATQAATSGTTDVATA